MKNLILLSLAAIIKASLENAHGLNGKIIQSVDSNIRSFEDAFQRRSSRSSPKTPPKTSPISQSIKNRLTHYTIDVLVGTPRQRITLQVDTGSSDTWMNWVESSFCQTPKNRCEDYGTFDFEASSSKQFVEDRDGNLQAFRVSYTDNARATGKFVKDDLVVGGQVIRGAQFGLATQSNVNVPVLGLGLPGNEVTVLLGESDAYPNFVPTLVNQGLIKTSAYSLWLNDLKSESGTILFGGVDTAKFEGKLESYPVQTADRYKEFTIVLNNIAPSGSPFPVEFTSVLARLDAGTSYIYVPSATASAFWKVWKAIPDPDGYPYIPCELAKDPTTIDFTFGSKKIRVPMSQLVFRNPDLKPLTTDSGVTLCVLGILPTEGKTTLGLTFLRSAYVVYDVGRNEVSIAQAKYTSRSVIHELGKGGVSELYKSSSTGAELADEDYDDPPQEEFFHPDSDQLPAFSSALNDESFDNVEDRFAV